MDSVDPNGCDGCLHLDALHDECRQLMGRLACEQCRELWDAVNGFECPTCGSRASDLYLSDVSEGPSRCCPGFEPKPKEPARQQTFF